MFSTGCHTLEADRQFLAMQGQILTTFWPAWSQQGKTSHCFDQTDFLMEGCESEQRGTERATWSAQIPRSIELSALNSSFPSRAPNLHMLRTFQNWAAISQIWSLPEGRRGSWVKSLQTFWNKERMKNWIFLL